MPIGGRGHGRTAACVGATIIVLLLSGGPASAGSSLKSRHDLMVGAYPVGVLAVDYDGDGFLDIISVGSGSDSLDLLKGFGDGTLRRVTSIATTSVPSAAAFVDVNNDGRNDLVASNKRSQDLAVRLGDGLGGFGGIIRSGVTGIPTALAMGDWNLDGRVDAATANPSQNNVTVLLGDGAGRFTTPLFLTVGTQPEAILSADLDLDGRLDLVVVNYGSDNVQVWRGNGAGGFTLHTTLTAGDMPNAAAVADFNGDGKPDLAVSAFGSDSVRVFGGDGTGGFGTPSILSPGFGPRAALATDVTLDGRIDLVVGLSKVSGVGELVVLPGNGAGGFGAAMRFGTGPTPGGLAVGDFNNDGQPDVVTVNKTGNSVSVFQNAAGGGLFRTADRVTLEAGGYPHDLVVGDLNGDGRPDLASPDEAHDKVALAFGRPDGTFTGMTTTGQTGLTPLSIAARDLNHDGDLDLITANNGNDTLSILANNGAGSFSVNNGLASACEGIVALAAGEISGDVHYDINYVCEVSRHRCGRLGTGTTNNSAFGAAVCTTLAGTPASVALLTSNGDALEDAASGESAPDGVAIALANGSGGVAGTPVVYPAGALPRGMARGDLDGDGDLDLVVANSGSDSVTILPGGDPSAAIHLPVGLAPTAVTLADFNQDGHLDLATSNANSNNITLVLGDGMLRFTHEGEFGAGDLPLALGAGDFNQDGKPDLAVADNFSGTLSILVNESVPEDPLEEVALLGQGASVLRWGILPGATFDVIRATFSAVRRTPTAIDLGPVTCIANDIAETDTASYPDPAAPQDNDAFLYLLRANVGGVPGAYSMTSDGRPVLPASGDCP